MHNVKILLLFTGFLPLYIIIAIFRELLHAPWLGLTGTAAIDRSKNKYICLPYKKAYHGKPVNSDFSEKLKNYIVKIFVNFIESAQERTNNSISPSTS